MDNGAGREASSVLFDPFDDRIPVARVAVGIILWHGPTGQSAQLDWPAVVEYLPAAHSEHTAAPGSAAKRPGVQSWQEAEETEP